MVEQKYYRGLGSVTMIILGGFFLIEHILVWGGADIDDPLGHETYGILLCLGGYALSARRKDKYIIPWPRGGE